MLTQTPKSSAVVEIERLGFNWHEEAQYDIELLDKNDRVQVRESEHYAPKAQVAQYAVQMGQTPFPPIVVTRNHWTIDGNTRKEARKLRKEKYTAAIVVDVDYTDKGSKTDARLHALAATLNQTGGQRLTPAEARAAAKTILSTEGWKPEQISRAVGIKPGIIGQIKNELAAEAKFAKVGFTNAAKLSGTVIRAFGRSEVTSLNDVPYKGLADLAVDANLGAKEVSEMARAMKATGSDAGMIAYVETKRAEMGERIREHGLLGNGKPAPSSSLRRALGFVTKYETTPSSLVEHAPAAMQEHAKVILQAIEILQAAYKLQMEAIDA